MENPVLAENVSVKLTTCSFSAPEITIVLNVEPGSITSLMTRLRSASGDAAPGLFGSKSGSDAIARISPVRGRMTMPVMLTGACFFIASASADSRMC